MSNVQIGCKREVQPDGAWTVLITASGLSEMEAVYFVDVIEAPLKAAMTETTSAREFDIMRDELTGEVTPIKPETRQ